MGDRLAGSPAGWLWCLGVALLAWAGPRARLLPYVVCKRVRPDSLHPGFAGEGRGCPWSFAGCHLHAHAGSARSVSYGALGSGGGTSLACWALRVESAGDGGVPGGAGGDDGVELAQQAAGDGDPGLGGGELVVARAGQGRVWGGARGFFPHRRPPRPPGRQPELGPASAADAGLALVGARGV